MSISNSITVMMMILKGQKIYKKYVYMYYKFAFQQHKKNEKHTFSNIYKGFKSLNDCILWYIIDQS